MKALQTAERVSDTNESDNFVFQRSLLAYYHAKNIVDGEILEIGSGEGYGLRILSEKAKTYTMLDKYKFDEEKMKPYKNSHFIQTTVPPFKGIASNFYDFVVSFQVIEHIKDDQLFVKEIARALKPGGKLICSTPNIKMSLARNPWHVREYTVESLKEIIGNHFSSIEILGVFGKPNAMKYYEKNKEYVDRIMRLDVFKLQHRLPRKMLQIPYDLLNRMNRKKLLKKNAELTSHITIDDFEINAANDFCLDLYFIATK